MAQSKSSVAQTSWPARLWRLVKRTPGWLLGIWRPRDPVVRSLRLLKRYGGGRPLPEHQFKQLEQQARALIKKGQPQRALTVLHCLLLLKPDAATIISQVDTLTAAQHKLSLHSKGISGTTRAYRKQLLDLYVQEGSVQVLETAARL